MRILVALQKDSSRSIAALAEAAGVSASPCDRRIKSPEAAGVIAGNTAQIDPDKLGLKRGAVVEMPSSARAGKRYIASSRPTPISTTFQV